MTPRRTRPPAPALTILIADGDGEHRAEVAHYLRRGNFEVAEAADGASLRAALHRAVPDIVLLDLTLPGEGGLAVCRRLAASHGPPVIMLSRVQDETDRIVALELGADDYLERPISPRELVARIRSVLRRCPAPFGSGRRAGPEPAGDIHLLDDLTFEPAERRLKRPDGGVIGLSDSETSLLVHLLERPRGFVSRQTLAASVGGGVGHERRIDSLVARLRRKLALHGADSLIRTGRGAGYGLGCKVSRW